MKQVLVIDDTKNIRLLLTKTLEVNGYQVTSATNGREGLDLLLTGKFDLAFLDIKLPELSGTEVLRQARAAGVQTPVIIITAYPTVKNAVECTQMGAITYMQKPFTSARLHSVLQQLHLETPSPLSPLQEAASALDQDQPQHAYTLLCAELAKNPTDSKIYHLLGCTYKKMGDMDMAEKFFSAARIFE